MCSGRFRIINQNLNSCLNSSYIYQVSLEQLCEISALILIHTCVYSCIDSFIYCAPSGTMEPYGASNLKSENSIASVITTMNI